MNIAILIIKDMLLTFTGRVFLFFLIMAVIYILATIIGNIEGSIRRKKELKRNAFYMKMRNHDRYTNRY